MAGELLALLCCRDSKPEQREERGQTARQDSSHTTGLDRHLSSWALVCGGLCENAAPAEGPRPHFIMYTMKVHSKTGKVNRPPSDSIISISSSSSSSSNGQIFYGLLVVSAVYILVLWQTAQKLPISSNTRIMGSSWQVLHSVVNPFVSDQNQQLDIRSLAYSTPFPQTIRSEGFENIAHPAARYVQDSNHKPPDLQVPPFWNPKEFLIYSGVRTYLGNYGSRHMTYEEARSIGSFAHTTTRTTLLPTIFMAIASYRDYQCPQTVTSIFTRAKHPERIRVGVVDQLDFQQDSSCWTSLSSVDCNKDPHNVYCIYSSQMDFYEMDATYAVGPVFARHVGHRMYRGEYFAGQIDAHVDFVQDWDEDIVNQWTSAKNEMAVLTTYLSDIEGSIDPITFKSIRKTRPIMCDSDYEGNGMAKHLRHGQQPEGIAGIQGEPTLEPFWAAGFSFARGHFVVNVPYDQYLPMIFQGEEISLGLRAFSYGYDFYTPERSICFHYYAHGENGNKASREKVHMFWEHDALYKGVEVKAMKRLNGIIRIRKQDSSDWDRTEEKSYGLGQVRPVTLFYNVFGIHPEEERVEKNLCRFVGRNMHTIWKKALRKDTMGINYDEIQYRFKDPDIFGDTWSQFLKK